MHPSWKEVLDAETQKPYFLELAEFVRGERKKGYVFPPRKDVFNAFKFTPLDDVKVVLLGQDPYHNAGQAHGLAFSVPPGMKPPPSLINIFKELEADLGLPRPKHGCLEAWAKRGVLLLNTTLTVRAHEAGSHQKQGWETFTDAVIQFLVDRDTPLVFVLWGRHARSKSRLIDVNKHLIIESAHPSPLSAYNGFFGSNPFTKVNEGLDFLGVEPVDWDLSSCHTPE